MPNASSSPAPRAAFSACCLAGTHSGVGKTTVTLGVLAALRRRGRAVQPFKCGPDYIDPEHHTLAAGRISRNLDTWMMGESAVRATYARAAHDADAAVVEGVMGLFDGASSHTDTGSSAHVCRVLDLPVILVVHAKAMARSIAALVHGFTDFDRRVRIAGIVANQVGSERHARILRDSLAAAELPPLLGAIPATPAWGTAERHLGLVTALESGRDEHWFGALADGIETHVDLDRLLRLTRVARPPLPETAPRTASASDPRPRLGIARDEAFQFYYADNLDLLRSHGIDLVPFSPLRDPGLPPDLSGLYLGGGYPELHAEALSANRGMRDAIRAFAAADKPVYGECGGLMYLCESLCDSEGRRWDMCGVLAAHTRMEKRLRRLGYVEAETVRDGLFGPKKTRIRGHEFHWSDIETGPAGHDPLFMARPARNREAAHAGLCRGNVCASYLHLHFGSNPAAAAAWAAALRTERSAT